jgi:uncharacterized Zn finger protein
MAISSKSRSNVTQGLPLPPGRTFLKTLKPLFDASRLSRGREIFEQERVLEVSWGQGKVESRIKGRPRPYRDERSPPVYHIFLRFEPLPQAILESVLDQFGSCVEKAAQLVSHDLRWPEDPLLPRQFESGCSCPDERNPCKHVAALSYHMARCLDRDPLILLELRGMARLDIEKRLERTALGQGVLSALRSPFPLPLEQSSFFSRPRWEEAGRPFSENEFQGGAARTAPDPIPPSLGIPGLLVRKGGDYPGFWEGEESFVRVMDVLYAEVRRRLTTIL